MYVCKQRPWPAQVETVEKKTGFHCFLLEGLLTFSSSSKCLDEHLTRKALEWFFCWPRAGPSNLSSHNNQHQNQFIFYLCCNCILIWPVRRPTPLPPTVRQLVASVVIKTGQIWGWAEKETKKLSQRCSTSLSPSLFSSVFFSTCSRLIQGKGREQFQLLCICHMK